MLNTAKIYLWMALLLFKQLQIHQWLLSSLCQEGEDKDTLILLLKKQVNSFLSNKIKIIMLLSMMHKCSQETNQSFTFFYFLQPAKWLTGFSFFHYLLGCSINENKSWIVASTPLKTRQLKNIWSAHEDEYLGGASLKQQPDNTVKS